MDNLIKEQPGRERIEVQHSDTPALRHSNPV